MTALVLENLAALPALARSLRMFWRGWRGQSMLWSARGPPARSPNGKCKKCKARSHATAAHGRFRSSDRGTHCG